MITELLDSPVDADANFFTAGLNSLKVTRLHRLLCTRLAVDVPVTSLFSHPTARGVAAIVVDTRAATAQRPQAPAAQPPRPTGRSRQEIRAQLRRDLEAR